MLSRIALKPGVLAQVRPQCLSAVVRQASDQPSQDVAKQTQIQKAHALYNGPERDVKNFPVDKMPDEAPPVKYGFIPESWFQAFYDKTGVTGPYLFGGGLLTYLLSKEIWVVDHGFTEFLSFWTAIYIVNRKFGKTIADYLDKRVEDRQEKLYYRPIREARKGYEQLIQVAEEDIARQDAQKMLFEAKRENVNLQLEAIYRQRLADVHQQVKNRLDYQLDVQQTKRRFEQEHMVDWIISNVVKNISPQQEKESVTKCIADLKGLAAVRA
ncbi:ATP synthase subunit b, mitochondrial-like [Tubulanus polymorphus]|uniref:ATP synthase subunit b, mitochondrial-like n=1 Tax=Tubulanus polymorphus TaxID=672921 RepID=UPI003DA690DF